MKRLNLVLLITVVLVSCGGQEDYKKVRDEVIKFHDLVMVDQEKIIANQMKLDTLLKTMRIFKQKSPQLDTAGEKEQIKSLLSDLASADAQMNNWMQQFEPDVTGKSNNEAVKYFRTEEVKIKKIDSVYRRDIMISDAYLSKFRKLTGTD
ncbi:hypothetical protein ACXZ1K_12610 [Pedobacter sp. PWIIR3]